MKKLLIISLLLICIGVSAQSEWQKARRTTWKKTALNMGISLVSVALEMSGDALYDMGKEAGNVSQMRRGHTLQAAGYGVMIAIPLLEPKAKDIPIIGINYLAIRFTFGDAIYNTVRGLPLMYAGTTSTHDNYMSQYPAHGRAFAKTISFGLAIGININHW